MGDINLKEVLVFLDDLIVFSDSLEGHEARLLHVLQRLRENGLKLSREMQILSNLCALPRTCRLKKWCGD